MDDEKLSSEHLDMIWKMFSVDREISPGQLRWLDRKLDEYAWRLGVDYDRKIVED